MSSGYSRFVVGRPRCKEETAIPGPIQIGAPVSVDTCNLLVACDYGATCYMSSGYSRFVVERPSCKEETAIPGPIQIGAPVSVDTCNLPHTTSTPSPFPALLRDTSENMSQLLSS